MQGEKTKKTTAKKNYRLFVMMNDELLFKTRLNKHYDELKWLYCELFQHEENPLVYFDDLMQIVKQYYKQREVYLKALDLKREENPDWYETNNFIGMTMFVDSFSKTVKGLEKRLPYLMESNIKYIKLLAHQDNNLNAIDYGTVEEFCKLTKKCHKNKLSVCVSLKNESWNIYEANKFNNIVNELLDITNQGIDIVQLDIPKDDYSLEKLHTIIRMFRMLIEIVCPATLLLGNIKVELNQAIAYLGTKEKPELHMMNNISLMPILWHTVATKDVSLLKNQIDKWKYDVDLSKVNNYLRSEEAISWDLDYTFLQKQGISEDMHKIFLNQFYTGEFEGSSSLGKLWAKENICGTTASLCGIESFEIKKDKDKIKQAIKMNLMLHAIVLSLAGIPVIYSGDEIGQYNDYSYVDDETKDLRYIHQGVFNWRKAGRRKLNNVIQSRVYQGIEKLTKLHLEYDIFMTNARQYTLDTGNKAILAIVRETNNERFIGLYNFGDKEEIANIKENDGIYKDIYNKEKNITAVNLAIPSHGIIWLWRAK